MLTFIKKLHPMRSVLLFFLTFCVIYSLLLTLQLIVDNDIKTVHYYVMLNAFLTTLAITIGIYFLKKNKKKKM